MARRNIPGTVPVRHGAGTFLLVSRSPWWREETFLASCQLGTEPGCHHMCSCISCYFPCITSQPMQNRHQAGMIHGELKGQKEERHMVLTRTKHMMFYHSVGEISDSKRQKIIVKSISLLTNNLNNNIFIDFLTLNQFEVINVNKALLETSTCFR